MKVKKISAPRVYFTDQHCFTFTIEQKLKCSKDVFESNVFKRQTKLDARCTTMMDDMTLFIHRYLFIVSYVHHPYWKSALSGVIREAEVIQVTHQR